HFAGGSIIRTSRTNPARTSDGPGRVAEALKRLGVDYLITIGGDDTAFAASRVARTLPGLAVAHVPKTIDNDLPLPSDIDTFGFSTACNLGKDLVRNLMQDAATTERWFFVTVMGRRAGHLALGIGGAAGATLTVVAEEFPESKITLDRLAVLLEGGSNAMLTIQAGRLVPIPFGLLLDPKTGKVRVRFVEVDSEMYQTLYAYMIRLKPEDFDNPATVAALAKAGNVSESEFLK